MWRQPEGWSAARWPWRTGRSATRALSSRCGSVIRAATAEDLTQVAENHIKEKKAFRKPARRRSPSAGLEMKLVDVEYTFDNTKILFYFTADGRVDFRELVKDLAGVFRTRIELRQIGVRDEAKMLGGMGICGRPFCCAQLSGRISRRCPSRWPRSRSLSLNPVKISGACGRLMCCLKYEQEAYQDLLRSTPKVGALVSTPEGKGVVTEQNLLTRKLTIRLDKDPDGAPKVFKVSEVKVLRDGKIKVGKKELEELKKLEET